MSNRYLLSYVYECKNGLLGIGSVTMVQKEYTPINQEVLDDAIAWIRKKNHIPEDKKIALLGFFRFEEQEAGE